ncbi:glycoside hydrolase family 16 protein [Peniophora sp. CONT]|nr:glycoside hydrolase family 16 protein [Peniophora sp. CONT]
MGTGANTPLPGPKPPLPSTLLAEKLSKEDKPWMKEKDTRSRASYWVTLFMFILGIGGAAALSWRGWVDGGSEMIPESQLCSVFSDDFSSLDVDSDGSKWTRDVELGGFGNNEFEMTTNSANNLFVKNNQLYIMPTLTTADADAGISYQGLFDGAQYDVHGCTATSQTNCTVSSSNSSGTTIPPVMSARISTKNYTNGAIKYGKVEVIAKNPKGDWLWPAIWMLPKDSPYGEWPMSGEIDIMEARGNGLDYGAQGANVVRSSLTWGPMESLTKRAYGWQTMKRKTYAEDFHTYTLEWTGDFMKAYVDSRLKAMIDFKTTGSGGKSFWTRGDFPKTAQNGSSEVVVPNPYDGHSPMAPFDTEFYLIMNVAAGGTSGWFPDGVSDKPWIDGSSTAIRSFAEKQADWSATWPSSEDDRAMRVKSVKMWKLC